MIFIVDDNLDILINLKIVLELNNYQVITSPDGKKALTLLSTIDKVPEIIISDILMPELDGYDFFKAVSNNPILNHVPFVFLSGRNTPEDVRFGKMLGVDDYLTKPFKEEDLLAIIAGKISRNKKIKGINEKVEVLLTSLNVNIVPSISEKEKSSVVLLLVFWEDMAGPTLISSFPDDENTSISSEKIGQQLFNSMLSLYGQDKITKPEGVLLNIENIQKEGYIFFDSFPDMDMRGGTKRYMLGLIAPKINYFDSLKIKETFSEISSKIKQKEDWDIKQYWEDLSAGLWTHFSIK